MLIAALNVSADDTEPLHALLLLFSLNLLHLHAYTTQTAHAHSAPSHLCVSATSPKTDSTETHFHATTLARFEAAAAFVDPENRRYFFVSFCFSPFVCFFSERLYTSLSIIATACDRSCGESRETLKKKKEGAGGCGRDKPNSLLNISKSPQSFAARRALVRASCLTRQTTPSGCDFSKRKKIKEAPTR